jgi:hypothetical protein
VNVPYEVYEIDTRVTRDGAMVVAEPDVVVGKRDRQTRAPCAGSRSTKT